MTHFYPFFGMDAVERLGGNPAETPGGWEDLPSILQNRMYLLTFDTSTVRCAAAGVDQLGQLFLVDWFTFDQHRDRRLGCAQLRQLLIDAVNS